MGRIGGFLGRQGPAWHRSTHQHRLEGAGIARLATIGAAVAHRIVDIRTLTTIGSCPFDIPTPKTASSRPRPAFAERL
jgi:hypothetical protein